MSMKKLSLSLALLCLISNQVIAADAIVTELSGTLSAVKADGSSRLLSIKSEINTGETLSTEKNSYARIRFADGGLMTLRPNSAIKIDTFQFEQAKPDKDSFLFSLIKGGFRTVTGLVSKRGNKAAYKMTSKTATIGIRGTNYGALICEAGTCEDLPDGLYIEVTEGAINAMNSAGSQNFNMGQFGYVAAPSVAPVLLTKDPGVPKSISDDVLLGASVKPDC